MKQKKGFTLIEVLAVITLVALLLIIGFPLVINQVNKSKGKMDDTLKEMIKESANNYIEMNKVKYPPKKGKTYCLDIKEIVNYGYLKEPVINPSDGKEIDLNTFIGVEFISDVEAEYTIGACIMSGGSGDNISDKPAT